MFIHVVKPGESLYSISRIYNMSPTQIAIDNEIRNIDRLVIGQAIVIAKETINHTVTAGESLYQISRRYNVPVSEILRVNPQITDPGTIYLGQVITIPSQIRKDGTIEVNGYAFPNIDSTVLKKTFPYLTYLSIFSYRVKQDGSLTTINDEALISTAKEANVAPMMVITNIDPGKGFSSDIARAVLTNQDVQNKLIDNILEVLKAKGYYGLDIDFEYVYPEDREAYNNFLRRISTTLHNSGYILTTALAPKISAEQRGVLYEAHDYPAHGRYADHVILMTYEWGYTFGPPMAVAPINEVRKVLNYAVTAIPPKKILMGIPNYGYDWTLPYVRGTRAQTISNTGAVDLAARVGAIIQYDPKAQTPYFYYYDRDGKQHVVWFEDARSIMAKLMLVQDYNLGGVSYWTIGRYFPQNWLVLQSMYDVRKLL